MHRRTSKAYIQPDETIYDAMAEAGKAIEKLMGAPCSCLFLIRNDVTEELFFSTNIEDAADLIEHFNDGGGNADTITLGDTRDCMLTSEER